MSLSSIVLIIAPAHAGLLTPTWEPLPRADFSQAQQVVLQEEDGTRKTEARYLCLVEVMETKTEYLGYMSATGKCLIRTADGTAQKYAQQDSSTAYQEAGYNLYLNMHEKVRRDVWPDNWIAAQNGGLPAGATDMRKDLYLCRARGASNRITFGWVKDESMCHTWRGTFSDYDVMVASDSPQRFAPLVYFDSKQGTDLHCLPENPVPYYGLTNSLSTVGDLNGDGSPEKSAVCNTDMNSITSGNVPAFYQYHTAQGDSAIVEYISYWFFYGYQEPCMPGQGEHYGDWEHIIVKVQGGTLKDVKYYQHGGWYVPSDWKKTSNTSLSTQIQSFEAQTGAFAFPVVYVGKNSHGSYHDDGGTGGCLYWEDFRKPSNSSTFWLTTNNLIELNRLYTEDAWMLSDGYWGLNGSSVPGPFHPSRKDEIDNPDNTTGWEVASGDTWFIQNLSLSPECKGNNPVGTAYGCHKSSNDGSWQP